MRRRMCIVISLLIAVFFVGSSAANGETEAGYTDPTTQMRFVWVPGGCYLMGDTFGDNEATKYETPVHKICVDSYYMGMYEVTQGEWTKVMENNPSTFIGETLPVERVSWDDTQLFIAKLNAKSGKKYRLPTEAEWEYAARSGGKDERYAGVNDEKGLGNYAWYGDDRESATTHPVGQKLPNGLGLYDMSGNVWEWVGDKFDVVRFEYPNKLWTVVHDDGVRVIRGGCWNCYSGKARSSARMTNGRAYRSSSIGLRLVLSSTQ